MGRIAPDCEFAECPSSPPQALSQNEQWQTAQDPLLQFSFQYPNNLILTPQNREGTTQQVLYFVSREHDETMQVDRSGDILLISFYPDMEAETYFATFNEQEYTSRKTYQIPVQTGELITIHKNTPADGPAAGQESMLAAIAHHHGVLVFDLISQGAQRESDKQLFESIIETLVLQ